VVHDIVGHGAHGYEFGPKGEFNAYLEHSRMFSDKAKPALAAETLAQNSWVNYGPHLRKPDGSLPKKGELGYIPPADRKFADQKNIIIPQDVLKGVDDYASDQAIRYSPARDEEHKKAVESGDIKAAQAMVDEAAKKAGWGTDLLHHGTTYDFTVFSNQGANIENDHGKGFYFTNTPEDAAQNYAGEGPDLTSRTERRKEMLEDEIRDLSEKQLGKLAKRLKVPARYAEVAKALAREELVGGKAKTLNAYVKLEKPAVIGGKNETVLEMIHPMDEEGEYTDEEPTGSLVDFADALKFVAGDYGDAENIDEAVQEIYSDAEYDSVPLSKVMTTLRDHDAIRYATDDEGNLAASELIRSALEKAGYDGIVDNTVNKKFGSERRVGRAMAGMGPDTHHVIAFHPWSIKSAEPATYDNEGKLIPLSKRFNEDNNDIRFAPARNHAKIEDFADPEAIKELKNKRGWAIVTAEFPQDKEKTPEENAALNADLTKYLDDNGIEWHQAEGRYTEKKHRPNENPVIIIDSGMTHAKAAQLAKRFDQDSVLTKDGLVYQDESLTASRGVNPLPADQDNYFTRYQDSRFSSDLHFDEEGNPIKLPPDSPEVKKVKGEDAKKTKRPKSLNPLQK